MLSSLILLSINNITPLLYVTLHQQTELHSYTQRAAETTE